MPGEVIWDVEAGLRSMSGHAARSPTSELRPGKQHNSIATTNTELGNQAVDILQLRCPIDAEKPIPTLHQARFTPSGSDRRPSAPRRLSRQCVADSPGLSSDIGAEGCQCLLRPYGFHPRDTRTETQKHRHTHRDTHMYVHPGVRPEA